MLVKLKAPPGPERSEVMQLLEVFRARCVDVSDQSLTVCCSGDAGKVCSPHLAAGAVVLSAAALMYCAIR